MGRIIFSLLGCYRVFHDISGKKRTAPLHGGGKHSELVSVSGCIFLYRACLFFLRYSSGSDSAVCGNDGKMEEGSGHNLPDTFSSSTDTGKQSLLCSKRGGTGQDGGGDLSGKFDAPVYCGDCSGQQPYGSLLDDEQKKILMKTEGDQNRYEERTDYAVQYRQDDGLLICIFQHHRKRCILACCACRSDACEII